VADGIPQRGPDVVAEGARMPRFEGLEMVEHPCERQLDQVLGVVGAPGRAREPAVRPAFEARRVAGEESIEGGFVALARPDDELGRGFAVRGLARSLAGGERAAGRLVVHQGQDGQAYGKRQYHSRSIRSCRRIFGSTSGRAGSHALSYAFVREERGMARTGSRWLVMTVVMLALSSAAFAHMKLSRT